MNFIQRADRWHQTKPGLVVAALVEFGVAYAIGIRAIDTGSWWQYGLTLIFLVGGAQNTVRFVGKVTRERQND